MTTSPMTTTTAPAATPVTNVYAADVAAARARALATLDELQHRLDPQTLISTFAETAIVALIGPGSSLLGHARNLLRRHPLAVAGAGLALGATLLGRRKLAHATVDLGDDYEPYSDFDDDYTGVTGTQAVAGLPAAEDNPLTAVLAGLATGALIGALFPGTAQEDRLMGQSRARVTAAARAAMQAARSEFKSGG